MLKLMHLRILKQKKTQKIASFILKFGILTNFYQFS